MEGPKRRRGRPRGRRLVSPEEKISRKRKLDAKYKEKRKERDSQCKRVRLPIDIFSEWREVRQSSGAGTDGEFAALLLTVYQEHTRQRQDMTGTHDVTGRHSKKSRPLLSSSPSVQKNRPSCDEGGWISDASSLPSSSASVSPECEDLQPVGEEEELTGEDQQEEEDMEEDVAEGARATPVMSKSRLHDKASVQEAVDVDFILLSKIRHTDFAGQAADHCLTCGAPVTTKVWDIP